MKKLLLFLISIGAWAAGTVQQFYTPLGTSGADPNPNAQYLVIEFTFTGDASTGSVPATATDTVRLRPYMGYLPIMVQTKPGSPAPTAGYGLTVKDSSGYDVLGGAAASLSATASQSFAVTTSTPPVRGSLTITITGQAIASAKGSVVVFLQKPGIISAASLKGPWSGGTGAGGAGVIVLASGAGTPNAGGTNPTSCPDPAAGILTLYTDTSTSTKDIWRCVYGTTNTWRLQIDSDGTGGTSIDFTEGPCPSGAAGHDIKCADSTLHTFTENNNNGGYKRSVGASGTITANNCPKFADTLGNIVDNGACPTGFSGTYAGDATFGANGRAVIGQHGAGGGAVTLSDSALDPIMIGAFADGSEAVARFSPSGTGGVEISRVGTVKTTAFATVAGLPTCNAGAEGKRASVQDATATTFFSIVAGGGANKVPVYCDGTNWRIA